MGFYSKTVPSLTRVDLNIISFVFLLHVIYVYSYCATLVVSEDSYDPHQLHRSSKNMMSWFKGRDWSVGGALYCLISDLKVNLEQVSCSA